MEDDKKIEKLIVVLQSNLKPEHNFDSLNQIGFESYVSFIFNGNLNWLNDESKRIIKYGIY